jgi:hypothetical protein
LLHNSVEIVNAIGSGVDNILDVFGEFINGEMGGIIGYDFGLLFSLDFNDADLSLDFGIVLDEVLNFYLVLDSECGDQDEVVVFFPVVLDSGTEVICVTELDEVLLCFVGIVNGAEIDAFCVDGELSDGGLLYGALLFFFCFYDGILFFVNDLFFLV